MQATNVTAMRQKSKELNDQVVDNYSKSWLAKFTSWPVAGKDLKNKTSPPGCIFMVQKMWNVGSVVSQDTLQSVVGKLGNSPKDTRHRTLQRKMILLQRKIFMQFKLYRRIQVHLSTGMRMETSKFKKFQKKSNSMLK